MKIPERSFIIIRALLSFSAMSIYMNVQGSGVGSGDPRMPESIAGMTNRSMLSN